MSNSDDTTAHHISREQRIIIDQVFNHFHATGTWPTFGQLDRPLKRDDDIDALQVLHSMPPSLVFFNRSYADPDKASPVQLRLDALALCIGSERDLDLYFEAVRWFAELELAEPDPSVSIVPVTKQQYLNHLSSTRFRDTWVNATKLVSMLIVEGGYFGIGILQGPDGDWSVTITRDVRYLAEVETLDQYHEAFNKLSNGRAISPPLLAGDIKGSLFGQVFKTIEHSQADAPTALAIQRYAFIVMPFNEMWSDTTLEFIRRAIELLPTSLSLEILRADDITKRGDIPLQVIESIVGAAVVIADITASEFRRGRRRERHHIPNPNVMWELGYAMALDQNGETPYVIINQHLRRSPFDLLHSRQVEYSIPATDREIERLAHVISENLL